MFRTLVLAIGLGLPSMLSAAPAVVMLVRHAEKETVSDDDPPLTAAGQQRAEELARVVAAWTAAGGRVRAIFATDLKRTQQTVAPVAAATRIAVTVVDAKDTDGMARKILAVKGGVVVVAGHSNRVPAIIKALGGPADIKIEDEQFDRMFVVTAPGLSRVKMVVLRYGE